MKKLFLLIFLLASTGLCAESAKKDAPSVQIIEIKATDEGYVPSEIQVHANSPVLLKVTRTSPDTCATEIKMKEKKINQKLPLNETVSISLGALKKGDLSFSCGMDMFKGVIHVK